MAIFDYQTMKNNTQVAFAGMRAASWLAMFRGALYFHERSTTGVKSNVIRQELEKMLVDVGHSAKTAINYASRMGTAADPKWFGQFVPPEGCQETFAVYTKRVADDFATLWMEIAEIKKSGPPAVRPEPTEKTTTNKPADAAADAAEPGVSTAENVAPRAAIERAMSALDTLLPELGNVDLSTIAQWCQNEIARRMEHDQKIAEAEADADAAVMKKVA